MLAFAALTVGTTGMAGSGKHTRILAEASHQRPATHEASGDAARPENALDAVAQFGADPGSVADNAAAFAAIFADTNSSKIFFPRGTYRLSCGHYYNAVSAISLYGEGLDRTTIRFDRGCLFSGNSPANPGTSPLTWSGKSDVQLKNLTIDLNTPAVPSLTQYPILFDAEAGVTVTNIMLDHIRVINGTSPTLLVAMVAHGGTLKNPVVTNSFFSLARAAASQNQCITLYTYNAYGAITGAVVTNNVCVKTGIGIDGSNGMVSGNDISGFRYGTGIFTAYNIRVSAVSDHDNTIIGNVIHDTPAGHDVDNTPAGGIENSCVRCLIRDNIAHHLGGPGFLNYGNDTTFIGNKAYDNGKSGAGVRGSGDTAGFFLSASDSATQAAGMGVAFIGNSAYDDGPGTQLYGYVANNPTAATLRSNKFTGVIQSRLLQKGALVNDGAQ
jgi:hypothetical protein